MFTIGERTYKLGSELQVGDVIERRYQKNDRITALRPYRGTLDYLWDGKAQIATFAIYAEMTIEPQIRFEVFS